MAETDFHNHSNHIPACAGPQRDWRGGRLQLTWVAGERGIPSINADIQNATEATRMTADPDFELLGKNATTDDMVHLDDVGLQMQTDGADNDSCVLVPHQDVGQSPWNYVTWGTDRETHWEGMIGTVTDIATGIEIWAGLKLTLISSELDDPDMALMDDDDLLIFNFNTDDSDATWGVVSRVGGTAADVDTGVKVMPNQRYHFRIEFDAGEMAHCYIDDVKVAEVDFSGNTVDLKPAIAVHSLSGTTDELNVYEQKISRLYGAS